MNNTDILREVIKDKFNKNSNELTTGEWKVVADEFAIRYSKVLNEMDR